MNKLFCLDFWWAFPGPGTPGTGPRLIVAPDSSARFQFWSIMFPEQAKPIFCDNYYALY